VLAGDPHAHDRDLHEKSTNGEWFLDKEAKCPAKLVNILSDGVYTKSQEFHFEKDGPTLVHKEARTRHPESLLIVVDCMCTKNQESLLLKKNKAGMK
jgi:hypothetical protein